MEAIPEVELEYKERSSNWSHASLFNDRRSVQELARQREIAQELKLGEQGADQRRPSERSTRTNNQAASQTSTERRTNQRTKEGSKQDSRAKTGAKDESSKGTISTKKVSWTKFSEEMEKKQYAVKFSKSQATQDLEQMVRPHKPIKSAVYDQIYEEYLKNKPRRQLEIDQEFRVHRQQISNFSGEIKSLHTYKNSLVSGVNVPMSDGMFLSGRESLPVEKAAKQGRGRDELGGQSREGLIKIEGVAWKEKALQSEEKETLQMESKNPFKTNMQPRKLGKPNVPRRSSLDLDEFKSKYASTGNLFYRKSHMLGNRSSRVDLHSSQLGGTGKDIKIDVMYQGREPESIRTSEAIQKERFNRAVSRGKLGRRASLGVNAMGRRRSMSKSILESVKLLKQNESQEKEKKGEAEKKKKKKVKITDRLFKREDLIEAYDSLMKDKDKDKDREKRDWNTRKPAKKPRHAKQDSAKLPLQRRKTSVLRTKRQTTLHGRRAGSSILQKDVKKSVHQVKDTTSVKGKLDYKVKNVNARVDTGLKRKMVVLEDEQKLEKRRVKKDYALEKIILPQMELEINSNFELFMAAQDMTEVLMVQEPQDLHEHKMVHKAEDDRMDYVSDFDVKDHVVFHVKNTLLQFEFDFGQSVFSRTTNTCSDMNHPPQDSSSIYQNFASMSQNKQKLKRKQKKKNLHEKNESVVLNKRRFSKNRLSKNMSKKGSARKSKKKRKKPSRQMHLVKPSGHGEDELITFDLNEREIYEINPDGELVKSLILQKPRREFKSPRLNKRFDEDNRKDLAPEPELNLYDGPTVLTGEKGIKLTRSDVFSRSGQPNLMTRSHNNFQKLKHSRGMSNKIGGNKKKKRRRTNSKNSLSKAHMFMVKKSKAKAGASDYNFGKNLSNPNFYTNNIYNSASQDLQIVHDQSIDLYAQPRVVEPKIQKYSSGTLPKRRAMQNDEEIQFNVSRQDNRVKPNRRLRRVKNEVSMHLDISEEQDASISEKVSDFVGSMRENCAEMFESEPKELVPQKKPRKKAAKVASYQSKMFRTMANFKKNNSHVHIKKRNNSHRLKAQQNQEEALHELHPQDSSNSRTSHLRHRTMGQIKHFPFMIQKKGQSKLKSTNEENAMDQSGVHAGSRVLKRPPRKKLKKQRKLPLGGSPVLTKKITGSRKSNSSSNNQVTKTGPVQHISTPRNLFKSPQLQKKVLVKPMRTHKVASQKNNVSQKFEENYEFEVHNKELSQFTNPQKKASPRIKRKFLPPRKIPLIGKKNKNPFNSPPTKTLKKTIFTYKAKLGVQKSKNSLRTSRENLSKKQKIGYNSSDDSC